LYRENALQSPASAKPAAEAAAVRSGNAPVSGGSGGATVESNARERSASSSAGSWILLLLVRAYVIFLSPFLGGACKFYPSCSNYAREAIERHGARRGTVLALKRLLRCHPFTPGGVDLVPEDLPNPGHVGHSDHARLAPGGQGSVSQSAIGKGTAQ
jgi:uncharacterized protein